MEAVFLLIFLAILAIDVWAVIAVVSRPGLRGWLGASYWFTVILALVAAIWMTSYFSYYHNSNTHVFGWPVPQVIFQRDTPDSPWLDYVGPTVILAYPMNFAIYMLVPSGVFILISRIRRRESSLKN